MNQLSGVWCANPVYTGLYKVWDEFNKLFIFYIIDSLKSWFKVMFSLWAWLNDTRCSFCHNYNSYCFHIHKIFGLYIYRNCSFRIRMSGKRSSPLRSGLHQMRVSFLNLRNMYPPNFALTHIDVKGQTEVKVMWYMWARAHLVVILTMYQDSSRSVIVCSSGGKSTAGLTLKMLTTPTHPHTHYGAHFIVRSRTPFGGYNKG